MRVYKLFLDDERMPVDCLTFIRNVDLVDKYKTNIEWTIVRNYDEFCTCVLFNGLPELVSFDHDIQDGDGDAERTGLHCVKWLIDYCIDNKVDFPNYVIHSQNNVGPDNMDSWIKNFIKTR